MVVSHFEFESSDADCRRSMSANSKLWVMIQIPNLFFFENRSNELGEQQDYKHQQIRVFHEWLSHISKDLTWIFEDPPQQIRNFGS